MRNVAFVPERDVFESNNAVCPYNSRHTADAFGNAMRVWDEDGDFQTLIKTDEDIKSQLPANEIDRIFSLEHYLRNVDSIFERVFG